MNARCRSARACYLCPRPKSIGDPISRSGFYFSTNFPHLVRQSALLKSHIVKSSVTGPPRQQPSVLERIVDTSTNTISVSVQLSLLLLLSADSGTLGCSLHLFHSPLLDWCVCHVGLLFQTSLCKRHTCKQHRTAASTTTFLVDTRLQGC